METCNKPISVVSPVGEAIEKTKQLLFKPFNLEKWFVIGFCAWLATLFNSGPSFPNLNFSNHQDAGQEWSKASEFIHQNILLIGIAGSVIALFIITFLLVLLWLNCRGHFMFIDCLAKNKAQIAEPWKNYKQQANSLFRFRLALAVLSTFIIMLLVVPIGILSFAFHAKNLTLAPFIILICLIVLFVIIAAIFFGLIKAVTMDFVAPVMYIHKLKTVEAWKQYMPVFKEHFWKTILYMLFKWLILIVVGTMELVIFLLGCCMCCASILLMIPYIGTVIYLPFISFMRLYPLCFLKQFGDAYDVFVSRQFSGL
ncbi:MAG: hypothetical protein LLF92_07765 [Planctomycetaceae bacterium]|nr:hypothetical protein [Planctomycetaceae bacterium]